MFYPAQRVVFTSLGWIECRCRCKTSLEANRQGAYAERHAGELGRILRCYRERRDAVELRESKVLGINGAQEGCDQYSGRRKRKKGTYESTSTLVY